MDSNLTVDIFSHHLLTAHRYSGVARGGDSPSLSSSQSNRYIPPAQRPPTGKPTVHGAPFDPAIISSALAQPVPAATKASAPESSSNKGAETPAVTEKAAEPALQVPTASEKDESVSTTKTATNGNQKSTPTATPVSKGPQESAPAKPSQPAAPSPGRAVNKEGGVAATVEKDVVTAFKNFSAHEKMRAVENQRRLARQDKAVKLNDLKKFAQNFKLNTPVPQDLVPILAKDKIKQEEIMKKNHENVNQAKTTPPKQPAPAVASVAEKAAKPTPGRNDSTLVSPVSTVDKQNQQRPPRHNQNNFSQSVRGERPFQNQQIPSAPIRHQPGNLGPRLQNNMTQAQFNRQGVPPPMAIPTAPFQDPRMPPNGPSATSSGVTSPTSAARFNVKATEFRPNPAASTFQPVPTPSNSSSPARAPSARLAEQKTKQGKFFEGRKPLMTAEARLNISTAFNPIPRLRKEAESEKDKSAFHWNLGIRPAYQTEPRWPVPEENENKTFDQMFEPPAMRAPSASPSHPALAQQQMPHQHQLPLHLQHGGHMNQGPAHHNHRHMPNQQHHMQNGPHHYDDHQMRFTQSTSSVHPSPRAMPPFVAYNTQGGQPVTMYQNAVPGYAMSPSGHPMTVRQVSGGPHFIPQGPGMGGHLMSQQPSSGPYMSMPLNAPVQMYSPMPGQIYPSHNGPMPSQPGPNGYSSPRTHAPMMAHQTSQQGHAQQPMVYMPGGHTHMYPQGPQGPSK